MLRIERTTESRFGSTQLCLVGTGIRVSERLTVGRCVLLLLFDKSVDEFPPCRPADWFSHRATIASVPQHRETRRHPRREKLHYEPERGLEVNRRNAPRQGRRRAPINGKSSLINWLARDFTIELRHLEPERFVTDEVGHALGRRTRSGDVRQYGSQ